MGIDESKDRMAQYVAQWNADRATIETEEDARFRMIDLILTDVLCWQRSEVRVNLHSESGFADYLIRQGEKNWMVIEAKKTGIALLDSQNIRMGAYKVSGPAMQSALEGVAQARRYCYDHSVDFAGLTNGYQWIGFLAVRTDGRPYGDGKAIAFPSLEAILADFAVFYDLFSKEGVLQRRYLIHINKSEGVAVHLAEKLVQAIPPISILKVPRSQLSMDLDHVFREFFTELSGERDPEMIAKCFVESKESREADSSLEKIASRLISGIEAFHSTAGEELLRHIEVAVETQRGEFVLIVGEKGAGKSTFIDRFFRLVLSRNERDKCLVVKVDMADSPGDKGTVGIWITRQLIQEIEKSLFNEGIPEFNELRGIFIKEYERLRRGEFKHLYESSTQDFNIKFGEHVLSMVKEDPYGYAIALLRNCVAARTLMPCLVFDNTDHFPQDFQESVFQFAQAMHRAVFSFVICPITDRTIWQLSKQGPLQSYVTHAFYLPPPSPKEVLEKRIIFVRGKISEAERESSYFLERGIRVTVKQLKAFAASLEEIFINTDFVGRLIGGLSNFDIRRSLHLSHRIISSPVISIDSLVLTYIGGHRPRVARYTIHLALIKGDYSFFNQSESDLLLNMFAVKGENLTSPLVKESILRLLIDRDNLETELENKFMSVEEINKYFLPMGLGGHVIVPVIAELLRYRLVEPYDPSSMNVDEEQRIKSTTSGRTHMELVLRDGIYVSQMACTTAIRNEDTVITIREHLYSKKGIDWNGIRKAFISYCLDQDDVFITVPADESYDGQRLLRAEIKRRWTTPYIPRSRSVEDR
ncbi:MAG: hypothetical protein Q8L74_06125 [Nitrospirota bacterium]|nr:hypothetical protein [Nitrospirota bacterium]